MDKRFDKIDTILASLKEIEPSPAFNIEFKRRLAEAVAGRYEEKPFEKILRTLRESAYNLRNAILPETRVLVRVMATFIVVISVGYYVYSQPSCPVLLGREGNTMVVAAGQTVPKETAAAQKFRIGDTILVNDNSHLDIGMSDKYVIRIKAGSRLKIARLAPRYGRGVAEFKLAEGRVLVSVEEGFKGSKFIIDTKTAKAVALGTKFAVGTSEDGESETEVIVLQGKVEVKGSYRPKRVLLARQTVVVGPGQRTEVPQDGIPAEPTRLMEEEWARLEELYQIGRKPQVMLLVKNTPDRVKQLLRPCPLYITDEKPREVPVLLEEALLKTAEAVKSNDPAKHLESVKLLERIVSEYPNPKYDVQFMLYIGAYYEYLGYHEDAIKTFKEAVLKYPDSQLASMAQCAVGVIYEEKLADTKKANEAYKIVLQKYPNSLEAIWVEEKLGIKKIARIHKSFSTKLSYLCGVRG